MDDNINSLSQLRTRGFEIGPKGMDFIVGSIFNEDRDDISNKEIDSYFILCKIIIGKSYCKVVQSVIIVIDLE